VTWLADTEPVSGRLQRGDQSGLVVGVVDTHHHVDDGLRREARVGGRADVLDATGGGSERGLDPPTLPLESTRPLLGVGLDSDLSPLTSADENAVQLLVKVIRLAHVLQADSLEVPRSTTCGTRANRTCAASRSASGGPPGTRNR